MADGGPIRTVGLIGHGGRPAAVEAARRLAEFLGERGVRTRSLAGETLGADEQLGPVAFAEGLDLVVSVGGDGTLLRAAKVAAHADAPLLGVKVGRVGFLTQTDPDGAKACLDRLLHGLVEVDERTALTAEPDGAPWSEPEWALNEVIVGKEIRHQLVHVSVRIGGTYVTTYSGDGVIVATPTGSTAYAFSAGGPIVSPRVNALLLTPVAPHMVFDRSIVIAPEDDVVLEILPDQPGLLSADGRPALPLPVGASVRIRPATRPARLVHNGDAPGFFPLLRAKFSLPGEAQVDPEAP